MSVFSRHWPRMVVMLIPLVFALLHATDLLHIKVLQRLDDLIFDARLRATMPRTMDNRIVVVNIDEKSLVELGRWPWGRDKLAHLSDELLVRQQVAILGFDVLFSEADTSSGLQVLQKLAAGEMQSAPGFVEQVEALQAQLDFDAVFAKSLENRNVVLGYYFTSDRDGRTRGVLPAPVMPAGAMQGQPVRIINGNGYGANIAVLAKAAPTAGFFNAITDADGVVRSIPLLTRYQGQYYESLALAMFRHLLGAPEVVPGFSSYQTGASTHQALDSIHLRQGGKVLRSIPVDDKVATLVPFRGPGGPKGGSFTYISAVDVLEGRLPANSLNGKIVLVGATAPGLLDARATPVGEIYPGVEVHANVLSGMLDGHSLVRPDYAGGFEVLSLLFTGLLLALALPFRSMWGSVLLSLTVLTALVGLNHWLYMSAGLVFPLAGTLALVLAAFALNMSYGYFVESRAKRELANRFSTYVPPELVDEMVRHPENYSMRASNRELTVMFCDIRGFTQMSEQMEPTQLQGLLNAVFNRLTKIVRIHQGTIDKYMGDCVMAFWGAPVETAAHAQLAVQSALQMTAAVKLMNTRRRKKNGTQFPRIDIGIGLSTGTMCVGDMGSNIRRSYTVIGDAVNLGARLEGLSAIYGVTIVVSEATARSAPAFAWQELDRVRVKGKDEIVTILTPLGLSAQLDVGQRLQLGVWESFLTAYRGQDWENAERQLNQLLRMDVNYFLYHLYAERLASLRSKPFDPAWDGTTHFDTK